MCRFAADHHVDGRRNARAKHAQVRSRAPTTAPWAILYDDGRRCRALLSFGEVSYYLGYNAMRDFFPRYTMKPNPQCENKGCLKAQAAYQVSFTRVPLLVQ